MWWWVLLWVVLVLGAALVLGLIARTLWRKVTALTRELGEAGDRLSRVADTLAELSDQADTRRTSDERDWAL